MRRWFGTDGIRGRADEGPLAEPFLERLGRALGAEAGGGLVLVGRDPRESGPRIAAALEAGLRRAGARPLDLGVLPTAALGPAIRARRAALGIVISASHNPWQDNGIKVFGAAGMKLDDAREAAVEARLESLEPAGGPAASAPAGPPAGAPLVGQVERAAGAEEYGAWLLARFAGLDLARFRVAVDCAHGAASVVAPAVLVALGARVTPLFCTPDGRNINAGCGSTHPEALAGATRRGGHDLGFAFDGDADRVLLADAAGRIADGDSLLGFLGPWLDARGELPGRTVVATIMSNLGLEHALSAAGLELVRCPVGDRNVLAAMQQGGYGLGGEASGHVLLRAEGHFIGDGLFTALSVLAALADTGRDAASLVDGVRRVPQLLKNLPVAARPPVESLPGLQARLAGLAAEHGGALRVVLRYSGTERLARVMLEGLDAARLEALADELGALWVREIDAVAVRGP